MRFIFLSLVMFHLVQAEEPYPQEIQRSLDIIRQSEHCRLESGWGLFAKAEFLYWDMSQEGLMLGIKTRTDDGEPLAGIVGEISRIKPHFAPGVRVALGFQIPYDEWNVFARWTYLSNTAKSEVTINSSNPSFFSCWLDPTGSPRVDGVVTGDLRMHLNQLEAVLNRWVCTTKVLHLAPNFGFKALWFREKLDVAHTDVVFIETDSETDLITTHFSNRTDAYGGFGALEAKWMLGWGFSLLTNFSFSLLYAKYQLIHEEIAAGSIQRANMVDHLTTILPIVEIFGGLNWSHQISDDYYLSVWVGWEHKCFFGLQRRNQIFEADTALLAPNSQNLSFWGFSGGLEVGF